MRKPPALFCHVSAAREAAGETQVGLARKLGVSRQALSLVESGQSIPSTALALKLAAALGRTVEELFVLSDETPKGASFSVHWAETDATDVAGPRAIVGRIRGRLIAHPLRATALSPADVIRQPGSNRRRVTSLHANTDAEGADRLFVAGCAPGLGLFCDYLEKSAARVRASWIHATTAGALNALARKEVQVAGLHYPPEPVPASRRPRSHGRLGVALTFATWQQGLLVRRGDRRAPRNVAQLGARGVRLVRREAGASANRLLDAQLTAAGIPIDTSAALVARGHFGVGAAVALGAADVGVAAEHAAIAHDLDFVPLDEERFDLTFDASFVDDPRYQRLGDVLSSHAFRIDLQNLGGYDTKNTGSISTDGSQ